MNTTSILEESAKHLDDNAKARVEKIVQVMLGALDPKENVLQHFFQLCVGRIVVREMNLYGGLQELIDNRSIWYYGFELNSSHDLDEWIVTTAHEMGHVAQDYTETHFPYKLGVSLALHANEVACETFALRYLDRPGNREAIARILEPLASGAKQINFPLNPNPQPFRVGG